MKALKVFELVIDDGDFAFKAIVPAESKKAAVNYAAGNGEIIAIKENKNICVDVAALAYDLKKCGWSQSQIDLLTRTIQAAGLDMPRD